MLTGKCECDFKDSKSFPDSGEVYFYDMPQTCKLSLYLEFLEEKGYYFIFFKTKTGFSFVVDLIDGSHLTSNERFNSKNEAVIQSIIEINNIYNK